MNITSAQLQFLHNSLLDESLQDIPAIKFAKDELDNGNLDGAICYLSIDLDKIRSSHPDLYKLAKKMHNEFTYEWEPDTLGEFKEHHHEVVDPWKCSDCSTLFEPALTVQCPECLGENTFSVNDFKQEEDSEDPSKWIEKWCPGAPKEMKTAFVNALIYDITGQNGGSLGGPSARELFVQTSTNRKSILSDFDSIAENAYRMIFNQPICEMHIVLYASEITNDDSEEDVKAIKTLRKLLSMDKEEVDKNDPEYRSLLKERNEHIRWINNFPTYASIIQMENK